MSTVGVKLGSLVIRTISKPIATAIKAQARDHPTFRRICIRLAQSIHRTDMRLRLGLLRDAATIERLEAAERAAKAAAKEKAAMSTPTSTPTPMPTSTSTSTSTPTSTSTTTTATTPKPTSTTSSSPAAAEHHHITTYTTNGRTYHIRPLSETKAIDRGAAFISEFFLFAVAGSLILIESLRLRRKEANRQDIVTERIERLEERTRQDEVRLEKLEDEVWRLKGGKGPRPSEGFEVVPLWEGEERVKWWRRLWPGKVQEGEVGQEGVGGGVGVVLSGKTA